MGHVLCYPDQPLLPAEVVRRVSATFAYVRVDAEEGLREAARRAEWIERTSVGVLLGRREEALKGAARLRTLRLGEVFIVEFGDSPSHTLRFTSLPEEPIRFGYGSDEEAEEAANLLHRLARALGAEVEVF